MEASSAEEAAEASSRCSPTGTSEGSGAGAVVELPSLVRLVSFFVASLAPLAAVPLVFGLEGAAAFCLGGLLTSVFSCVLLALAAVGFIILSRKLPSAGATLRRVREVCEVREPGRCSGASEDRLGFAVVVEDFGVDVVELRRLLVAGFDVASGSCFARDEAVGAVRCEGRLIGLVVSLGLGLEVAALGPLSLGPDRAIEAAVGAVSELRLGFLSGALAGCAFGDSVSAGFEADVADVGVLALAGDLTELAAGFEGALVEMAAGLPVPLTVGFLLALFAASAFWLVDFLRSSATGGSACPPLTASALAGSAGFISNGSSSSPVTGLSGFSASLSRGCWPTCACCGFRFGVPATLLTAVSGPADSWLLLMLFFNSKLASASPKLPLRPALLSLGCSVAMLDLGSTDTKLARTLLVRLSPPFSLSAAPREPAGDRPRGSDAVVSPCLFSKSERRLRTAEEERFSEDMAVDHVCVNACSVYCPLLRCRCGYFEAS